MLLATMVAASAQANEAYWLPASGDFSTPANWSTGIVPTPVDAPVFDAGADQSINVDGNYTIERIYKDWNSGGFLNVIGGPGTLTVQGNAAENYLGIANRSGANDGGGLQFAGNVVISRPWGNGFTEIRNDNGINNYIEFTSSSQLTLQTPLMALDFTGGAAAIRLNGNLLGSSELHIQSPTVSFNTGHNSSAFVGNILFNDFGSKLAVNGGTVLSSASSFIGNWGSGELELNSANAVNDANLVTWGANMLLDVNSSQNNMGGITLGGGTTLTIDVDAAATSLFFDDSSANNWGGAVTINGFQEGVIKFGSDASGLTAGQLAAINGGIYNLTSGGYLTALAVPEPTALALVLLGGMGWVAGRRNKI